MEMRAAGQPQLPPPQYRPHPHPMERSYKGFHSLSAIICRFQRPLPILLGSPLPFLGCRGADLNYLSQPWGKQREGKGAGSINKVGSAGDKEIHTGSGLFLTSLPRYTLSTQHKRFLNPSYQPGGFFPPFSSPYIWDLMTLTSKESLFFWTEREEMEPGPSEAVRHVQARMLGSGQ